MFSKMTCDWFKYIRYLSIAVVFSILTYNGAPVTAKSLNDKLQIFPYKTVYCDSQYLFKWFFLITFVDPLYVFICMYICVYIYREREKKKKKREREREMCVYVCDVY